MGTQTGGGGIRAVERARVAKSAAGPASRPAWRFRVAPTAGAVATAAKVAGAMALVGAVGTAVARSYAHAASGPIDAPVFPHVNILPGVGSCSEREGTTVAALQTPREGGAPDAFLRRNSVKRAAVDPQGGTRGNFVGVLSSLTEKYASVLRAAIAAASGHDAHGAEKSDTNDTGKLVNLVINPLLTLSYHYGAEIDARAFYAAVASLPVADSRRLTVDVCMLVDASEGRDRYQRAFAAARRVCEYRRPTPPRLAAINAIASLVSQPPPVLVSHARAPERTKCAVANVRDEAAVHLCAYYSSSVVGIMVAADGGRPARDLVRVDRNSGGGYVSVDAGAMAREEHATHEEVVVSAWMRGECEAGNNEAMNELFWATIAYRWGVVHAAERGNDAKTEPKTKTKSTETVQNVDYAKTTSAADFGDAWVVRDARLRNAGAEATAALVFVIGPNASSGDGKGSSGRTRNAALTSGAKKGHKESDEGNKRKDFFVECVRVSVRAGLDAMIRSGVGLALVTRVPCVEDEGVYAISDAEFVALVNGLLQEKVAYVDDGSPTGQSACRLGGSRAERGRYFDAVLVPLGGLGPPGPLRFGGMRVGPPHRFV